MAQVKLPIRIKVDVRDQFDAPNCTVQKAFATLGGIVGLKTQCEVEWDMLFHTLRDMFEDNGTFVPIIAETVVTWCDVLSTRFEDDNFSAWTDELVDKMSEAGLVKLHLQADDKDRPTTKWSDDHRGFVILFPSKSSFSSRNSSSGFESDFQTLFMSDELSSHKNTLPIRSSEDEWAEITEAGDTSSVSNNHTQSHYPAKIERMPNIATLPTLDVFLRETTPYILFVIQKGSGKFFETGSSNVYNTGSGRTMGQGSSTLTERGSKNLVVQGTHGPTLRFLEQYLQRWVKKDHDDSRKVPLLRINLHESNFGIGISHDTLTIEPYDTNQERRGVSMNPAIVLLIIENILGYHCVSRFNTGVWEYRRETPFE